MAQLFANNAATTLASPAVATDTALTLADGSSFPSPAGGDFFLLTLATGNPETAWEIVKVTARSGNVATVARAQEGTTAQAWAAGAKAELRLTAGSLQTLAAGANTILHGIVDPTSAVGVDGNFYINEASHYLFGPKAAGVWPAGVSLVGAPGTNGLGVPAGGTTGQALVKLSNVNNDTGWAAVGGSVSNYSSLVMADSPVAYWRFDDDYTSVSYHDSSGNGYDAIPVGGHAVPCRGGVPNDINRGVNIASGSMYANIPTALQTAFPLSSNYSIEFLVNLTVGSPWGTIFEIATAASSANNSVQFRLFRNGVFSPFFSVNNGSGVTVAIAQAPALTGGSWYHIVGTYDGATAKLYINGSLVASGAGTYTVPNVARAYGGIWTDPWYDAGAQGFLDELALYNSTLSAARILQHFKALA